MPLSQKELDELNFEIENHNTPESEDEVVSGGFRVVTPDAKKYHRITGPLALNMPPLMHGATMIPRAGSGGVSRGFNPHAGALVTNVIDTRPGGEPPMLLDFSRHSHEELKTACATAKFDSDPLQASLAACKQLSVSNKQLNTWLQRPPVVEKNSAEPQTRPAVCQTGLPAPPPSLEISQNTPELPQPPPVATPRAPAQSSVSRAAMFDKNVSQSSSKPTTTDEVQPPSVLVTFEIPNFGEFVSTYHAVVQDGLALVLVYDRRWTFGLKYMPQGNKDSFIVDVQDHAKVYKVICPGIKYGVGNFDHCVLLIEEAVPKQGVG